MFHKDKIWFFAFTSMLLCLSFIYISENNLKKEVEYSSLKKNWLVSADGEGVQKKIDLPLDLRKVPGMSDVSSWTYSKTIEVKYFDDYDVPAVVLGRIGDSDQVYFGSCFVGNTGFLFNKKAQWWWGKLRVYKVNKKCLQDEKIEILIKVKRWGIANFGIYAGPIGIGEYSRIIKSVDRVEFFRFKIMLLFSGILVLLGVYYLFLYFLIRKRKDNLVFGLFSIAGGVYELFISAVPYRIFNNTNLVFQFNFLSSILVVFSFLYFIQVKFELEKKFLRIFKVSFLISIIMFLSTFLFKELDKLSLIYSFWFPLFLLLFFYYFYKFTKKTIQNNQVDNYKYIFSFSVFTFFSLHDVIVSSAFFDVPFLLSYGFLFVLMSSALALAQEYADAFLYVEEQVETRTKDLAVAVERLKDLEQMKDRFFANISHDFKTPIAVAMGSLEEIKRETLPTESVQRRAVIAAENSLKKLLSMVAELLDIIKAESGTLKMDWVSVNPFDFLTQWMEPFTILANKKNLKLNIVSQVPDEVKIPLDISKFERVMQNLLSNAIKFTNYNNSGKNLIEIQLNHDQAWYYIEVHDSGMGIPDDEKPMVFERYYQTSKTSLKHHGGSGIGLSFVKEMVENHNGTISVKDSEHGGVKFVIKLPLSQNVEMTGNYSAEEIEGGEIVEKYEVSYPRHAPKEVNEGLFTILIAEDNPEVANITLAAVEKEFNVYMVENGQEAFDFIQSHAIDCLVTDIVMPIMRGEELIKKVRSYNKTEDLPILVLSSQSDENTVVELLKNGANDYVTKPFKREILLARIYGQIEKHKSSQWISQNEKVIELGMLASGIAHQIRNGLHAMKNQISYYEKTALRIENNIHELSDEQRQKIKVRLDQCNAMMMRALNRIDSLTASVNSYSLSSKKTIEINLQDSITLMKELLADKIKSSAIAVEIDIEDNIKFFGYTSFHEVIINLFSNSIDACKHDGTGIISLHAKSNDRFVTIEIADNGQGINKDALARIWQPFFTTKDPDKGTGLGLYIVRDIVQGQHGGKLNVYSDGEGLGARFVIEMPKVAKGATQDASIMMHGHEV